MTAVIAKPGINPRTRGFAHDVKAAVRAMLPRSFLNWRDARFYGRYGEVELHILGDLCHRDRDSIDVGANEGCYVNVLRAHSRRVIAFEPLPWLAARLTNRFAGGNVDVREIALSNARSKTRLRLPVVNGTPVEGCSSIADAARTYYRNFRELDVETDRLDDVYAGACGFIKIDVEGHEEEVLEGAKSTIARSRPRALVEVVEYLSPGGVARVAGYFHRLNYQGYFIHRRSLLPLDAFDPNIMQNPADAPDLDAPIIDRERFAAFVYNFIFLPQEEPKRTVEHIAARIARL